MEAQIKLAARLYECRDTCKKLWGDGWKKEIEFHTKIISACKLKHNYKDEILAAMRLINDCKHMDGSGVFTMKVLAAAVEMIEPEGTPQSAP